MIARIALVHTGMCSGQESTVRLATTTGYASALTGHDRKMDASICGSSQGSCVCASQPTPSLRKRLEMGVSFPVLADDSPSGPHNPELTLSILAVTDCGAHTDLPSR